jgi:ABC-type iron transport system FetAB ATPase subunit
MGSLRVEALRFHGFGPVDLEVGAGECVAVTGPSGAGKTLLLRAIADLDPHEGRVSLDGVDCVSVAAPRWRRRVGLLRAESRWWRDAVGEHFCRAERGQLARLGFDEAVLRAPVARLSSGERQRLALLRLLANRPQALLLDEPTAHLDASAAASTEALLRDYRTETGAAVVWVTHDAGQSERVAQRRFRMLGGRLEARDGP